jgi:hypothetical protein
MHAATAAPIIKALITLTPEPEWTDFERDFLASLIHQGATTNGFSLTPKQEDVLMTVYYRHILMPKAPKRSAKGQAEFEQRKAKAQEKDPRKRQRQQDDEPPF